MSFSRSILILGMIALLWWSSHAWCRSQQTVGANTVPPAFALSGSAYGSLAARLIRDSLYSYWHGGESFMSTSENKSASAALPLQPPPGRFARKGIFPPSPPQIQSNVSWFRSLVDALTKLEKNRTKRISSLPLSAAHRHYLNAAADVRLRFAYRLDPGDAILYEILHFHIATHTFPPEAARSALDSLAQNAMIYAVREGGSLSDALTGAGAAINMLNDQLQPRNPRRDINAINNHWRSLELCLERYQSLRSNAQAEGWWNGISDLRRQEFEEHASLLIRIRDIIKRSLLNEQGLAEPLPQITPKRSH